jgi:hypothetical protein
MSNQHKYVINLIGNGIRYWLYSPTKEEYRLMMKIKRKSDKSWSELFFDFDFLKQLNRNHWSELANSERKGFLLLPGNLIEIRKKNRVLEKFGSIDLIRQTAIFPLYQTTNNLLKINNSDQFAIVQYEKGLIAKYEIHSDKLDLNQLMFNLVKTPKENLIPFHLSEINYLEKKLERRMDDGLITSLFATQIH